jgi:glycosyltransferase involved in cell wall biosynthesis
MSLSSVSTPRILFVDHAAALGGAELYLYDVARHYRATSTVVLFEEGPLAERLRTANVPVRILPASKNLQNVRKQDSLWNSLRAIPSLLRLVAQLARLARQYDLVYLNSQKALIVGGWAGWFAGRPVVWNLHDMLTADHFSSLNRRLAVWSANAFVDRVIVNSEATARAFRESGGTVTAMGLTYNGIDPAPFHAVTDADAARTRTALDLTEAPVVGVFSRLAPWKGQHVLLDAVAGLPDVQVLFVGGALFGGDASYETQLRERAQRPSLAGRVHFLGFREDVPTLMRLVDVVAHTSTSPEPFGRVIVEGQLAGTPVVAAAAGGAREIITSGRDGLLVPPSDVDALRQALARLLGDPPLRARLAATGRSTAEARFTRSAMLASVDAHVRETVDVYRRPNDRGLPASVPPS